MSKLIAIGIIIFVGVMIVDIATKRQVSVPVEKQTTEHWMLAATPQPFPDRLVPVVLTSKYPIADASGIPHCLITKGIAFFQQSLPPPTRLD